MSKCQIFTEGEIVSMREAGKILHDCLQHLKKLVRPGTSGIELDREAEAFIRHRGAKPAFLGYQNFPATICASVNDEIVHAIPTKRVLNEGDIISLDCGVKLDDLYTDACITVPVGNVAPQVQAFLDTVETALDDVLAQVVKANVHVGTISAFIQEKLEARGYAPVEQLTGHGLGKTLHQFPNIPNIGRAGTGPMLPAHTIVAIEPIASMASPHVAQDEDLWTLRTADGSLACHFEHTVLLLPGGCEVLS